MSSISSRQSLAARLAFLSNTERPLYRLPNEIVYQIASEMTTGIQDAGEIRLGYLEELGNYRTYESPFPNDTRQRDDLCSMALSCRRLSKQAQRVLFRDIKLCTRWKISASHSVGSYDHYANLLRTLNDRPDLAQQVRHLSIDLSHQHKIAQGQFAATAEGRNIMSLGHGIIADLGFSRPRKVIWTRDLLDGRPGAICGVILALLPQLLTLELRQKGAESPETIGPMFGQYMSGPSPNFRLLDVHYNDRILRLYNMRLSGLETLQGFSRLRCLRLTTRALLFAYGLRFLPQIENLEIQIDFIDRFLFPFPDPSLDSLLDFQHIKTVHLDVRLVPIKARCAELRSFLKYFIPSLPSLTAVTYMGDISCNPFEWKNFASKMLYVLFFHLIRHLPQSVHILSLPCGYWCSPHRTLRRLAIPLKRLQQLQHLVAPHCALISDAKLEPILSEDGNMDFLVALEESGSAGPGTSMTAEQASKPSDIQAVMGYFREWARIEDIDNWPAAPPDISKHLEARLFEAAASPLAILPFTLRTLVIRSANHETYLWIQELFAYTHTHFKHLESVELVFDTYDPEADMRGDWVCYTYVKNLQHDFTIGTGVKLVLTYGGDPNVTESEDEYTSSQYASSASDEMEVSEQEEEEDTDSHNESEGSEWIESEGGSDIEDEEPY
ncbi:hypothetical protein BU24DRAFT_483445 [Aaosphaeria arxii CBS 175.79]|uniref:Uncharacterized protein n=1 Tax=Aaosphaeria arxii CBS 175.79 TaxID=1450172 RepID=A0A6A5XLL2_9PLEO|nr:uncharacterized protein BU24DRAFT_483445 [Aaosphaeria arxii CBS 175.79]KAF2013640.1 hypothetical protein BU24DRAFT_483445 [Aaosphaeria arxii CBS 175.79]